MQSAAKRLRSSKLAGFAAAKIVVSFCPSFFHCAKLTIVLVPLIFAANRVHSEWRGSLLETGNSDPTVIKLNLQRRPPSPLLLGIAVCWAIPLGCASNNKKRLTTAFLVWAGATPAARNPGRTPVHPSQNRKLCLPLSLVYP